MVLIPCNIEYRYDMVFIIYFDVSNVDRKGVKINYDICRNEDVSSLNHILLHINTSIIIFSLQFSYKRARTRNINRKHIDR